MILSVKINEKSFSDKQLLQDVNFSINEGEKVGLIGRKWDWQIYAFCDFTWF